MDIDRKTAFARGLPGRFYDAYFINEYGKIEALRSTRYNTCFSVVLITVDGHGDVDPSEGAHLESIKALAKVVTDSVRNCDVAGMACDRELVVILPETDYFGSLIAVRKLTKAAGQIARKGRLSAVITQATFPRDGKGFGELLSTAAKRARERKESVWERQGLKDRLFWEIIGELSGRPYSGFDNSSFEAGSGQDLTEFFIDGINELVLNEVMRAPQKRGVLYYASKSISSLPVLKALNSAGALATRVFLVGEPDGNLSEVKSATPIPLDDPRLKEFLFTFFLNEDSGYALVCKENWGATFSCFHTADPVLVEGLISKFQGEYSLQENFG
ncbi:MAG: hypothetical protein HY891_09640 [Deltaproteobacteria bacterium]|nr:hypothetical protein [Deltaproteobacteria bacterium]